MVAAAQQAKDNMLFASTAVANGACVGIVNSIGMATEIGKIQAQIQEAAKEEDDTPLKKKIDEFGELLAKVGRVVSVASGYIEHMASTVTWGGAQQQLAQQVADPICQYCCC